MYLVFGDHSPWDIVIAGYSSKWNKSGENPKEPMVVETERFQQKYDVGDTLVCMCALYTL